MWYYFKWFFAFLDTDSDSDALRGLFKIKLHMEVLYQDNITKQYNILNKYETDFIEMSAGIHLLRHMYILLILSKPGCGCKCNHCPQCHISIRDYGL